MRKFPITLTGTHQLPDSLVWAMWDDYSLPMSLSAVARKYGRSYKGLGDLFKHRGLPVRAWGRRAPFDPVTGRLLKAPPATAAEITAMVEALKKIRVPDGLKREWRKWSWEKRGAFLARLRQKFKTEHDRPETPYSDNVEPWDYATARAHEIARRQNAGCRDAHTFRVKIKLTSWGVIWRDQLYYWAGKETHGYGYMSGNDGPYVPGVGRPLLHHLVWEAHHQRAVPAQHTVIFLDGNKNNLNPANLALRHRETCLRQNQAKSLQKKARAMTALLLDKHQTKPNHESNRDLTQALAQRRGKTNYGQRIRS